MQYHSRPAWRNQWFSILLAIALIAPCAYFGSRVFADGAGMASWQSVFMAGSAVAALILLVAILYRHYSWSYAVHDDVVESRRGIIGRDVKSIRIRDLRNINVQQGVFERLFGVGTVEFSSAGGAGIEVSFDGVTRPLEVKRLVQDRQSVLEVQRSGVVPVD